MNAMLARMLHESQQPGRVRILALAHGGDFIYDGRRLDQWAQWMTDHELTVTVDGQLLPIIPARGNHDGGKMFNEVFAFPPENQNFYAVDSAPKCGYSRSTPRPAWPATSASGSKPIWRQRVPSGAGCWPNTTARFSCGQGAMAQLSALGTSV